MGGDFNDFIYTITVEGSQIYVGGDFLNAASIAEADRIVVYDIHDDDPTWKPIGGGLNGPVMAIKIVGSDVYVGGDFTDAGGIPGADNIARWDGRKWNALGDGLSDMVYDMEIVGTDVYAVGRFEDAGGIPGADAIARWDGSAWHALEPGLSSGTIITIAS